MKKLINIAIWVAVVAALYGGCTWIASHQEIYTVTGTCVEKNVVGSKSGTAYYYVIIKFDDGEVRDYTCSVSEYVKYTVGSRWTFTRNRWK